MTENKMVGWHHRFNGHEFEQALGVGEGQGSLACCSLWGGSSISLELHGACLDHSKGKGSLLEQLLLRERTEHLKSQREVRCWEKGRGGAGRRPLVGGTRGSH